MKRILCFFGYHDMLRWRTLADTMPLAGGETLSRFYRCRRCRRCAHVETAPVPAVRKRQEASNAAVRG